MTTIELDDVYEEPAPAPVVPEKTTHLAFDQAMADFHVMFPDMDTEVIETVLRANKGAVDATIDQLLALAEEEEKEAQAEKESIIPSATDSKYIYHAHFIAKRTHRKLQPELPWQQSLGVQYCNADGIPILLGKLPPNFLRLDDTGAFGKHFKGYDSEFTELNSLLQSPEFVEALKMDRDFMQSLSEETQRTQSVPKGFHAAADEDTSVEIIKENLSRMSKASRRKLTRVARGFMKGKKALKGRSSTTTYKGQSIMSDFDEYETMSSF